MNNDEATRLLNDGTDININQPVPPVPDAALPQAEPTNAKTTGKSSRQGVGAGTVAAAAGLAAAAGAAVGTATPYVVAAALLDEETGDDTGKIVDPGDPDTPVTPDGPTTANGMPVAHVNASSFSEAFAEARAQVGPGGVFEYEGRVYGTYYANEWNAMSPAQQAEFTRNAIAANAADHAGNHSDDPAPVGDPETTEAAAVVDDADKTIMAEVDDSDVRIIGVEDIPLDNGDLATAIITTVDDTPVAFVDLDNDNVLDVAVVIPTGEEIPVDDGKGGPAEIVPDDAPIVTPTDFYYNDFLELFDPDLI